MPLGYWTDGKLREDFVALVMEKPEHREPYTHCLQCKGELAPADPGASLHGRTERSSGLHKRCETAYARAVAPRRSA